MKEVWGGACHGAGTVGVRSKCGVDIVSVVRVERERKIRRRDSRMAQVELGSSSLVQPKIDCLLILL